MEWRDEGVLIALRRHGESAAIIEVFTVAHGRHAGVVRGGGSRRMAATLQPGSQLQVDWRARLDDHLGTYTVDPLQSRAGLMAGRLSLAGLNAVCAMLHAALPERQAHPALYAATMALLAGMERGIDWPPDYLRWEVCLLEELGFGLDLGSCAVTGARDGLAYVSPRTGRAVSAAGAGAWADRLLPLPQALMGQGPASPAELGQGLAITGHFLRRELADRLRDGTLPPARGVLLEMIAPGAVAR